MKKKIDWEKVEEDYRIGRDSLRVIAARYNLTEGAIRKRANTHNWQRDLRNKINQRATAIMQREAAKQLPHERDIVEANAQLVSEVGLNHKLLATKAREKGAELLAQLDAHSDDDLLTKSRIYQNLVGSLEKAINIERVAFGMNQIEEIAPNNLGIQVSFVQPIKVVEEILINED